MVLKPNNGAKRVNENVPPSRVLNQKALVSRLQGSMSGAKRPRNSNGGHSRGAKYAIERSKRRNEVKTKLRFHLKTKSTDVEMADGTSTSTSTSKTQIRQILLPQELPRPPYKEIDVEILRSCAPGLDETNLEYLYEHLTPMSSILMQSLSSIRIDDLTNKLPKEMMVTIDNATKVVPSHILAVFGPQPKDESTKPRQVTLFPVHSLVLAVNCAHLPSPPPVLPAPPMPVDPHERQQITLPVFSLSIPSPESYPHLSQYLYTRRLSYLARGLLPSMPPQSFLENTELADKYAQHLALTFTPQVLVRHVQLVHGFWQNVCALGVFDDTLWSAMDVVWRVLLKALALSTGEPTVLKLSSESLPVLVKEAPRPPDSAATSYSSSRTQVMSPPPTPAVIRV